MNVNKRKYNGHSSIRSNISFEDSYFDESETYDDNEFNTYASEEYYDVDATQSFGEKYFNDLKRMKNGFLNRECKDQKIDIIPPNQDKFSFKSLIGSFFFGVFIVSSIVFCKYSVGTFFSKSEFSLDKRMLIPTENVGGYLSVNNLNYEIKTSALKDVNIEMYQGCYGKYQIYINTIKFNKSVSKFDIKQYKCLTDLFTSKKYNVSHDLINSYINDSLHGKSEEVTVERNSINIIKGSDFTEIVIKFARTF